MTSYDVRSFRYRYLTCTHCQFEYHFTTDGSGIIPYEEDYVLWSFNVYVPQDINLDENPISVSTISRCTHCQSIIWADESVNTYWKRLEDRSIGWDVLNSSSRPQYLTIKEYAQLSRDEKLTKKQQETAVEQFWLRCCFEYQVHYDAKGGYPKDLWPPSPDFQRTEKLLPILSNETDPEKINKAELLRHLGKFPEAIILLKQVKGQWRGCAKYLINRCRKRISHPVIIPPRTSFSYRLKKWINRRWPYTFRIRKVITIEDYY